MITNYGKDWDCAHGVPHKQCGSCHDQTEPPFIDGLGGRFQLPYKESLIEKLESIQQEEPGHDPAFFRGINRCISEIHSWQEQHQAQPCTDQDAVDIEAKVKAALWGMDCSDVGKLVERIRPYLRTTEQTCGHYDYHTNCPECIEAKLAREHKPVTVKCDHDFVHTRTVYHGSSPDRYTCDKCGEIQWR